MISRDDLENALSGDPEALDAHLDLIERGFEIDGCSVKAHCHCLLVDANGRIRLSRLAEFMRNAAADYAIPRSVLAKAKERDRKYNSTEAVAALHDRARRSFTDLAKSGEGGEMLLFLLAERFLKLPQILCKMDLKTDSRMHYHGADGVYASVREDGVLKLYWGESKIYSDPSGAIRDCLASIAPFLAENDSADAERERDLFLLSDKADLTDPVLNQALRSYFDRDSALSARVQYCGVALVGFDFECYPANSVQGIAAEIKEKIKVGLVDWKRKVGERVSKEKLENFEMEFFFLPLPSADNFRSEFFKAMGFAV